MNILSTLVELLSFYVKDTMFIPELDISTFAKEQNILLRDDHLQFLMRFGRWSGGRSRIFKWYGGDFDFLFMKEVYLENSPEMELPPGTTYFGSNFVGDSFCIDYKTGEIFAYDEGLRYGLVHENIDGFLLRCLLSVYDEEAFSKIVVRQDLDAEYIREFKLKYKNKKIIGATSFEIEYKNSDILKIIAEYYLVDMEIIVLYPTIGSLVTLKDGVLERLKS